jgi:PAS domain S-box-containing protein
VAIFRLIFQRLLRAHRVNQGMPRGCGKLCERKFMSDERRESDLTKDAAPRRRTAPWLLGGLVLFLLSVMVALQVAGLWSILPPDTASDTLLLYALSSLNFAAFIVFAFILVRSLLKLRRERRERQLGSKIKTRLVVYFITLSLLPITAMAVFSYLFLNRSIEKFFSYLPEGVVSEAKQLQREADANQFRSLRDTAAMLGLVIDSKPELGSQQMLEQLMQRGNLAALEILSADGQVQLRSEAAAPGEEERKLLEQALASARATANESEENAGEQKRYDAISMPLSDGRHLIVARARLIDSNLSEIISGSQGEYVKLVSKQRKVRLLGISTLGLLTLLLLFASIWTAIHLARGIATPIRALAEASKEVARGNLEHRVTTIADDELALLADSFNQMTAQLQENRRRIEAGAGELREKNLALEERRNYIETVLESLSTGVVSLDESGRITTINTAATTMLRLVEMPESNCLLSEITGPEDQLVLERLLRRARRMGRASEQTELGRSSSPDNAAIPVALTATALRAPTGETRGAVLVIEDLSELLSAQRAAAWSEVARRMAHEIKNPLTPIQLSAERIAKNFHRSEGNGNGTNGETATPEQERVSRVVDECTATITREVAGLKAMVDEFSRFARLPHARLEVADLNEVVTQTVALYEDRLDGARLDVHLARTLPVGSLDAEQMRRALVNLIDNALESLAETEGERRVTIATGHDPSRGLLLIEIADTGQGISRADFARLFQPYFSTRGRGTGLGLAIVQRIIIEHGGRIRAEMNRPRGAKFTIELPVANV